MKIENIKIKSELIINNELIVKVGTNVTIVTITGEVVMGELETIQDKYIYISSKSFGRFYMEIDKIESIEIN